MDVFDKEEEALDRQKGLMNDYKETFKSPQGQRVLMDLMKNFYVFGGTFQENPNAMYFNEGCRSVVMEILGNVEMSLDEFKEKYSQMDLF